MRGQISIEVALMMGIAILVIVSLVNVNFERLSMAREIGEAGEAKMVATFIAGAINKAYANGAGFQVRLSSEQVNFTKLGEMQKIEGTGVQLPIIIDNTARKIVIQKNMSKTGGEIWNATVSIIPNNTLRRDPSSDYPELTIRNNGTNIIIYADAAHIDTVG
ncbi:hypothetical protein [Candidatus Pyrohabitans sp.]